MLNWRKKRKLLLFHDDVAKAILLLPESVKRSDVFFKICEAGITNRDNGSRVRYALLMMIVKMTDKEWLTYLDTVKRHIICDEKN